MSEAKGTTGPVGQLRYVMSSAHPYHTLKTLTQTTKKPSSQTAAKTPQASQKAPRLFTSHTDRGMCHSTCTPVLNVVPTAHAYMVCTWLYVKIDKHTGVCLEVDKQYT